MERLGLLSDGPSRVLEAARAAASRHEEGEDMSAYAPEQQQAETEVVSGQVVGIITRAADKWQVSVNTGGQYAKNLWTKDAGLVNQMQGAIGQSFDFICGASHWQGQNGPVRSLWIN